MEEEKAYEISVKAVDRAGNQTVQRLTFEVVPKMTLAEKILEPVKKTLGMEETRAKEKDEDLQENPGREKTGEWQLVLGSCAGPCGHRRSRMDRLEEEKTESIRKAPGCMM